MTQKRKPIRHKLPETAATDLNPDDPRKKNGRRVLIPRREVIARVGLAYPTIWAGMQAGWFPRSKLMTPNGRKVGWFEHEIDEFLASRPNVVLKSDRAAPEPKRRPSPR